MFLRSLTVLFAVCSSAIAQTNQPALRIGTWNLEFLGAAGNFRNNLPPRDPEDYAAIGKQVRDLGVAVLAVQEICGAAPLQQVAAGAGPQWRSMLGTSGGWDDGKTSQQIGFLYDEAAVELLGAAELLHLPREQDGTPIFHRVPVTAAFRHRSSGVDFRIVTVHLKAGKKDLDETKRRLEATELQKWLSSLAQGQEDQDIVLLGDFNSTYGTAPQTVLEQGGAYQYLAGAERVPTIMHFPEPIDQVVVNAQCRELERSSYRVHSDLGGLSKDAWRKIYSDHFPVTVTITVAHGDDDPDSQFSFAKEQLLPVTLRPTAATPAATAWPPPVGSRILVHYGLEGAQTIEQDLGTLLEPLPAQVPGWVVLQSHRGKVAIPLQRVLRIQQM